MVRILFIAVYLVLLSACSSAPYHDSGVSKLPGPQARVDMRDSEQIQKILNQQYQDWRDVKHSMGGTSKKGIDCSGLVYETYRTRFGVAVPRTTEKQSKMGHAVKKQQLKAGDLVFFKTGVFKRHVGMYIERGEFLHVSSRKGVTISSLDDAYWKSAYWKARRIQ